MTAFMKDRDPPSSTGWLGIGALPAWGNLAVILAMFLVIGLYALTAVPTIASRATHISHYNRLADALLAGRTSLLIKPRPELLALPDPYDPLMNQKFVGGRALVLHDASLYNGKYYVYFGVVPALTAYIPYYLVTGHQLPTPIAALFFGSAALLWSFLLVDLLGRRLFAARHGAIRAGLVLAVGLGNFVLFLMQRPAFYEVAILAALSFVMGGLFFLARGSLRDRLEPKNIATGSLLLGLAIGCRPHMAVVGVLAFAPLLVALAVEIRRRVIPMRSLPMGVAAIVGPWSVCVLLLACYNYHRFGSFKEFGARYTLVGGTTRIRDMPMLDPTRLRHNLYGYLFHPPEVRSVFPYVELTLPRSNMFRDGYLGFTPIAGVAVTTPVLLFLALAPLTLVRAWKAGNHRLIGTLIVLLAAGAVELLLVACFSACARYTVDFLTFLVLAALLVVFDLDESWRARPQLRRGFRFLVAVSLALGCAFNLALSIEGQHGSPVHPVRDRLQEVLPRLPLSERPVQVKLSLTFPEQAAEGRREAVFVTGAFGMGNHAYLEYGASHHARFLFSSWGLPPHEGKAFRFVPGRTYSLELTMERRSGDVTIHLDGDRVLACRTQLSVDRSRVFLGENPIQGTRHELARFSGTLQMN